MEYNCYNLLLHLNFISSYEGQSSQSISYISGSIYTLFEILKILLISTAQLTQRESSDLVFTRNRESERVYEIHTQMIYSAVGGVLCAMYFYYTVSVPVYVVLGTFPLYFTSKVVKKPI